ncbi:MAG: hypothetical protein RR513_06515 [Muribaculaceae bacterium]
MKKNKKFTIEEKIGDSFILRITESSVTIESLAKQWKVVYSNITSQYGILAKYCKEKMFDNINTLAQTLFMSSLIFADAELVKDLWTAYEKSNERINARKKTISKEEDNKILEEELLKQMAIDEQVKNK